MQICTVTAPCRVQVALCFGTESGI